MSYFWYSQWGPRRNLDFYTAVNRRLVDRPEARAVDLLRSVCDEERFSIYAQFGVLPVLGNETGNPYIITRCHKAIEFSGGNLIRTWCLNSVNFLDIPKTDDVVMKRSLIEGNEAEFRSKANPNPGLLTPSPWTISSIIGEIRRLPWYGRIPHVVDL